MSKHTAGNWSIRSNEPLVDSPYSIMSGNMHIATISWNMQIGMVQQRSEVAANAKLISAAPDLLAALKLAKAALKELAREAFEHTSAAADIEAAIKKATSL